MKFIVTEVYEIDLTEDQIEEHMMYNDTTRHNAIKELCSEWSMENGTDHKLIEEEGNGILYQEGAFTEGAIECGGGVIRRKF